MPPWVDSIRNSRPLSADGVHPIPAFCVHPNRSPDGRSLSISGVSGSDPDGPAAWVLTFRIAASSGSKGLVATGASQSISGSAAALGTGHWLSFQRMHDEEWHRACSIRMQPRSVATLD